MADAKNLRYGLPFTPTSAPGYTNFALDANNDALEFIFSAREAATITRLGFRYGTRTGTPPTYRISLQGVGTGGNPDGTILGGGSPASATFTPPADATWNGTWQWVTLANSIAVTRGQMLALVIDYSAGTIDGSNNGTFTELINGGSLARGLPYAIQNAAGSRTKRPLSPVFGYGSATKAYGHPSETHLAQAIFGSAGTPDEIGMSFSLPAGWGDTFKVAGLRCYGAYNAGGTIDLTIYDTDGSTALQRVTWDTDHTAQSSASYHDIFFDEASLSALACGSTYTLSLAPSGTITQYGFQVDTDDDWEAWPGGMDFVYRTRTDAGAWTDDATKRLFVELILDDITEPAGGGGGAILAPGNLLGGIHQ